MRVLAVAPAVPFRGHTRRCDRARPIALSKLASTPGASNVIERNSPVAV
jgi:hypothetical protein